MNPRPWPFVAIVIATLSTAGCNPASSPKHSLPSMDSIKNVQDKGPIQLVITVNPRSPRLSDLVEMTIEVTAQPHIEVKPPVFGQAVGDFVVRDYSEIKNPTASDASQVDANVHRFRYQLEPTHAGKHLIRSIPIEFEDHRTQSENSNGLAFIESDPIEIEVTSELGDQIPDLASIEPMMPPRELVQRSSWVWLGGALPLVALLAWVIWRRRHNRNAIAPEIKPNPSEIASDSLRALLSENLPAQGRFQEFYVRLTGIVRVYIEGTTGVHAPDQTTEEFLVESRSRHLFRADQALRLQEFLEAADMVKYAGQRPDLDQIELSIVRAREFLEYRSAQIDAASSMAPTSAGKV